MSSNKSMFSKFSSNQLRVLIALLSTNFTAMMMMSIIGPFFPLEANKKGMGETVNGLVFSMYGFVQLIMSPISGRYIIPTFGAKNTLVCGLFFSGFANVIFGLLTKIDDLTTFTLMCFIVRFFESLGATLFYTATYTIIMKTFPENVGVVFGLIKTCTGLGYSLNAALGGLLYNLGGYGLPFYLVGSLKLIIIPLFWLLVKQVESEKISKGGLNLLKIPELVVVGILVLAAMQTIAFINPTLEPLLRTLKVTPNYVGLFLSLMTGIHTLFAPMVGWLAGMRVNKFPIMTSGQIGYSLGLILLNPYFLTSIQPQVWMSALAMAIVGIAHALAIIPTFESMLKIAIFHGYEDNTATYSLIAGVWNTFNAIGEITGPALGGWISDKMGISFAATVMAGLTLLASLFSLITGIVFQLRIKSNEKQDKNTSTIP